MVVAQIAKSHIVKLGDPPRSAKSKAVESFNRLLEMRYNRFLFMPRCINYLLKPNILSNGRL